jgi:hypothetical protein
MKIFLITLNPQSLKRKAVKSLYIFFAILFFEDLGFCFGGDIPIEIANSSFESYEWDKIGNLPATSGWGVNAECQLAEITMDSSTSIDGVSSIHLLDLNTGKSTEGIYYQLTKDQLLSVRGKTLFLRGWIKQISSIPSKKVRFGFAAKSQGEWVYKSEGPDGEGFVDWTEYAVKFIVPESADQLRITLSCAQGWRSIGEAYFDHLSLMIVDPPSSEVSPSHQQGSMISIFKNGLLTNWKTSTWGGISIDETDLNSRFGERTLRVKTHDNSKIFSGFKCYVPELNRRPNIEDFIASKGNLKIIIKPAPPLNVALGNNETTTAYVPTHDFIKQLPDGWQEICVPLSAFKSESDNGIKLSGVLFQFSETPQKEISISQIEIISEKESIALDMRLSESTYSSMKSCEGEERLITNDPYERPTINNGTFYLNNKPHFFIGPWHYDNDVDFRGILSKRDGYGDIPYYDTLFNSQIAEDLGFNSLQLSSHPLGPTVLNFDLPLSQKNLDGTLFYPRFLKGLKGMPFVLDFAWVETLRKTAEEKWGKEVLQKNTGWHQFIPLCPEHPRGIEIYKKYWKNGASFTLNNGGNPFIYELFNESAYNCTCRFNREDFCSRMRKKYSSFESANTIWKTDFKNFEEVVNIERFEKFPALWTDWAKFLGDRYVEVLNEGRNSIREIDRRPNVFFTEQPWMGNYLKPTGATMDYWKIARTLDVLCVEGGIQFGSPEKNKKSSEMEAVLNEDSQMHSLYLDMACAAGKGKPIVNNELYCGRFKNGRRVPSKREDLTTSLWNEVIHGSSGAFFYAWDKRSSEWKTYEEAKKNVILGGYKSYSLLNPYNYPPEALKGIKDFSDEIKLLGEVVLPKPRIKGRVGLLFSYPSLRAETHSFRGMAEIFKDCYFALRNLHYSVEVVYEEDAADMRRFQAVVVPFIDRAYPQTLSAIDAYVRGGGIVLTCGNAFNKDEYGNDLAYEALLGIKKNGRVTSVDAQFSDQIKKINYFKTEPTFAETKLFTMQGDPLLFRNSIGKGFMFYLGAEPSYEVFKDILPRVLKGVDPNGILVDEKGKLLDDIELQVIDRDRTKLLYIVNWGDTPQVGIIRDVESSLDDFYIVDPIKRERYLTASGKSIWKKNDLRLGLMTLLPSQVRKVLLLNADKSDGYREVSVTEVKAQWQELFKSDLELRESVKKEEEEALKKRDAARKYDDVRSERCFSLDISKYANKDFRDETEGDLQGGWFDQGANDLRNILLGRQVLAGVPFEIIDPKKNGNKGAIILAGHSRSDLPSRINEIPFGRKAAKLYFLHTVGWEDQGVVLSYRVCYSNGTVQEIPIVYGKQVSGWWKPAEISDAKIALEISNQVTKRVGIYCYQWINPCPELIISSVDIVSGMKDALPAVIAITGEE